MSQTSVLALMREATRRVEAQIQEAMLVQVTSDELTENPTAFTFVFKLAGENKTAVISCAQGKWSEITHKEAILGLIFNDLLRSEIDLAEAVERIRGAGYKDPVYMCGLFQALSATPAINPKYNFTPDNCSWATSDHYIFVDSVTGSVELFPKEDAG